MASITKAALAASALLVGCARSTIQNELEWSSDCSRYLDLTSAESSRLTGGCARLTFCVRGSSYADGLFGYRMDGGECLSPGPVIRMEPGSTYGLVLCSDGGSGHPGSNLHAHGLHISGNGNSDDITRHIYADSCGFYEWNIPENHMGGSKNVLCIAMQCAV